MHDDGYYRPFSKNCDHPVPKDYNLLHIAPGCELAPPCPAPPDGLSHRSKSSSMSSVASGKSCAQEAAQAAAPAWSQAMVFDGHAVFASHT